MLFVQILAYAVLAGLGAVSAEALEAKLGQHIGMGLLAGLGGSWIGGWTAGLLLTGLDGTGWRWLGWLTGGVCIAAIAFCASFIVYSVNYRQAAIISAWLGIGHILLMAFWTWAVSTV